MKTEYNSYIEIDNSQNQQVLGWYSNIIGNLGITQSQTRALSQNLENIVKSVRFNGKDTPESIFRETIQKTYPNIELPVIRQAIKNTPKPNGLNKD